MDWIDMSKLAMVASGLWVFGWRFALFLQILKRKIGRRFAWDELLLAIIGLYCSGYYLGSFLNILIGNTHQTWVRFALLLYNVVIGLGAAFSVLRHNRRNK